MSEAHLPPTGSIRVVKPKKAAKLVEEIARDTEDPNVPTERLLIVLDIDGTILLEDETLSPGVVDAVEHAHRAGHEVMLATGRSWEGTRGIVRVLRIAPEFIVCSNGAVIMRRVNGDEAHYERFHTETFDAREVLTLLREHLPDARYMVELADGASAVHRVPRGLEPRRRRARDLRGARRRSPCAASSWCRPGQSEQDFVDLVSRIGLNQVSYAVGWTAWLDIAPKGVDKSTALERVREWTGFDPAHVLVIGDGRNDVGMFTWARENGGRAVAMEQGPQEVRDAAGETTLSVHEGGVAEVLRNL